MRLLRAHRRALVVWSTSGRPADRYGALGLLARPARTGRIRRCARTCMALVVIGLMRLAWVVRPRWRPLLAGVVLTAVGASLRSSVWGIVLVPGLLCLWSALLIPGCPDADRKRRCELERELGEYWTPAQRSDLETILDQYPDDVTHEIRDILASQAMAANNKGIPGTGRHLVSMA